MRFLSEFRDPVGIATLAQSIRETVSTNWTIMEVCGGQTHSIARYGLEDLLPDLIRLAHGPGCPVCVTPVSLIDKAVQLSQQRNVILCSFGDMLRVPGSEKDLFAARATGGDVRIVYSPMDALELARRNPGSQIVFFAVGFETTAPANAMAVYEAKRHGVPNFSVLSSHALVPPAMEFVLSDPETHVDGFLAAGHVCAISGESEYRPIAKRFRTPIVITGFEPIDILQGILLCVRQLEAGTSFVENPYKRVVRSSGNEIAMAVVFEVFEPCEREWRGMGIIPNSGLALRDKYRELDAESRFAFHDLPEPASCDCRAGEVLRGKISPELCPLFGTSCTPLHPLGAPMVSSEGSCSAYFKYRRSMAIR